MGTEWERRAIIVVRMHDHRRTSFVPTVFIDAGDLAWTQLQCLLSEALMGVASGAVVELASGDSGTGESLAGWCALEGHSLIRELAGGETTSFWIRKE